MNDKIAVVILNYKSNHDTACCIDSLKTQRGIDLSVIVVDNASGEEVYAELESLCRERNAILVSSSVNRGYNAGNNLGLRQAYDSGCRYAMICNPDMIFEDPVYLKSLKDVLDSDSGVVAAGGDIVDLKGRHLNPMLADWSVAGSYRWISDMFRRNKDYNPYIGDYGKSGYCDMLAGSAFMIRLDYLEETGYLDEGVFLYCEESILGRQVACAGGRMYYLSDVSARHNHAGSVDKRSLRRRFDDLRRSRLYFIKRHSGMGRMSRLLASLGIIVYTEVMKAYTRIR